MTKLEELKAAHEAAKANALAAYYDAYHAAWATYQKELGKQND